MGLKRLLAAVLATLTGSITICAAPPAFARSRSVDSFQEPDEPAQSKTDVEPEDDGERAPSAFTDEPPPSDKPSDFEPGERDLDDDGPPPK